MWDSGEPGRGSGLTTILTISLQLSSTPGQLHHQPQSGALPHHGGGGGGGGGGGEGGGGGLANQ